MAERIKVALCRRPEHGWRHFVAMRGEATVTVAATLEEVYANLADKMLCSGDPS